MALMIETPNGPRYTRIDRFLGDKGKITVSFFTYTSAESRLGGERPLSAVYHQLELPMGATMTEMYTALKLRPEFANATDC